MEKIKGNSTFGMMIWQWVNAGYSDADRTEYSPLVKAIYYRTTSNNGVYIWMEI